MLSVEQVSLSRESDTSVVRLSPTSLTPAAYCVSSIGFLSGVISLYGTVCRSTITGGVGTEGGVCVQKSGLEI